MLFSAKFNQIKPVISRLYGYFSSEKVELLIIYETTRSLIISSLLHNFELLNKIIIIGIFRQRWGLLDVMLADESPLG